MHSILPLLRQALAHQVQVALRNVEFFERRRKILCWLALITFPLYYWVWTVPFPQAYENLSLRLLGAALFLPLLFAETWPKFLDAYRPYYWYLSILYSLPFFFVFMLLKNNGSDVWMASALVAVFVMVLALDWKSLIFQFVIGAGLAWGAYLLTTESPQASFGSVAYLPILLFAIALGAAANYGTLMVQVEQERTMLATAGSIAHELRTPLLSIRTGASGLQNFLPVLIDAYQQARRHELPVGAIRSAHLEAMIQVLENIEKEVSHSNTIIDMLLVNARLSRSLPQKLVRCSIRQCVDAALARYPFTESERALVHVDHAGDFSFQGNELLTVHILFNLIKNALRHIGIAGKGDIAIVVETRPDAHRLRFRDTGGGVAADAQRHIFERFYTSSRDSDSVLGAGIGLAFCRDVMHAFGGAIECESTPLEFTEFILTFPKS
jgi:two-component system CAI-1 autoinducer sensor kinase/phosphatase CqsS